MKRLQNSHELIANSFVSLHLRLREDFRVRHQLAPERLLHNCILGWCLNLIFIPW